MLAVSEVTVRVADGKLLLDRVSIEIAPGEIVAVVGSNGAGKTTLLRTIAGIPPTQQRRPSLFKRLLSVSHPGRVDLGFGGRVSLQVPGRELRELNPFEVREAIAAGVVFVPATENVFSDLSVEDNLAIVQAVHRGSTTYLPLDAIDRFFPVLRRRRKQLAGSLSGGEKRALAIARGVLLLGVAEYPFRALLVDEPSHGLDYHSCELMALLLEELKSKGAGILIGEASASFAARVAARVFVMEQGRLTWAGTKDEFSAHLAAHDRLAEVTDGI